MTRKPRVVQLSPEISLSITGLTEAVRKHLDCFSEMPKILIASPVYDIYEILKIVDAANIAVECRHLDMWGGGMADVWFILGPSGITIGMWCE